MDTRRSGDYLLALAFCILSIYSKDNGLVVIGILAAMIVAVAIKPGELIGQMRYWAIRFAPFVIIAVSYVVVRYILIGPINPNQNMYSPRLSLSVAAWQAKAFVATVGNFALTRPETMGTGGFSSLFAAHSLAFDCFHSVAGALFLALSDRASGVDCLILIPYLSNSKS
jgi:hypothetical protein